MRASRNQIATSQRPPSSCSEDSSISRLYLDVAPFIRPMDFYANIVEERLTANKDLNWQKVCLQKVSEPQLHSWEHGWGKNHNKYFSRALIKSTSQSIHDTSSVVQQHQWLWSSDIYSHFPRNIKMKIKWYIFSKWSGLECPDALSC